VKPAQWLYAYRAMRSGIPHFIVRSPDALLTGMAYMGLLPTAFLAPWWDKTIWPENVNFLTRTRIRFWMANHHNEVEGRPVAHPVKFPMSNRKQLVPNSEAEAIATFAEKPRRKKV
jgi:hypothetical protein